MADAPVHPPLEWLVDRRARVQGLLLDLDKGLPPEPSQDLQPGSPGYHWLHAYLKLIGAAFSLWRAVFLVRIDCVAPIISARQKGDRFLEFLLRDNAIAYKQDQDTDFWSSRYYLNNALYRINEVHKEILPFLSSGMIQVQPLSHTDVTTSDSARDWDVIFDRCQLVRENLLQVRQ